MAVTLFEAQDRIGMDAHGLEIDGGRVDVPLRVMSSGHWQRMLALAERHGQSCFEVDVHTSCSWQDGRCWFRSGRMPLTGWPIAGSLRYLNLASLRLAIGLGKLTHLTRRLQSEHSDIPLSQVQDRFHPQFWRGLVLPILATICTCEERHLLNWPARPLLTLLHGILHSDRLFRLSHGTSALADSLADGLKCHLGSPVKQLEQSDDSVTVLNARGDGGRFDHAAIATQANQLDFLQGSLEDERRVLSAIPYADGELLIHRDPRFMPARRKDWTALNFQMDRSLSENMFTVWVNAVEPTLAEAEPVFQTWNPLYPPAEETVLARIPMQRAVVSQANAGVLRQLAKWHDQPNRRVFYTGSWAWEGVPLLESGVRSAESVVKYLRRR